ncbi:pilus assembly protein PilM [Fusibacter sp. JL216-2]|uniref:pilus assembly protein PilM n=1 Tax=Fusibacter sp. JL216-2 TaxID=3071453 RepID=UPI003D334BD7
MSKVLGVDIDYRSIKMALVQNGKKPKVLKTVEIPLPYGATDRENRFISDSVDLSLAEVIKKNKLGAKSVAINIRKGFVREFSFTGIKEKEIKNALELELSSTIQDIAVSYQLNYKIYEKSKKAVQGLVAFCPHKYIESALSYQDKLTGTIKFLDVYPNALNKALKHTLKNNNLSGPVMVVEVGYRDSIITIIENQKIRISRIVNSGAYHLDKIVSEEFSITVEEAEAERKSYYKNYFADGIDMERFIKIAYQSIQVEALQAKGYFEKKDESIQTILLTGDGIEVPSFDLYMKKSFEVPVRTLSPTDAKGKFIENYHRLLPAIGVAIREEK